MSVCSGALRSTERRCVPPGCLVGATFSIGRLASGFLGCGPDVGPWGGSTSSKTRSTAIFLLALPSSSSRARAGSRLFSSASALQLHNPIYAADDQLTARPHASDLAGFLPRPEPIQRKPRKKHFTAKVLAFFFLCHAVPAVVAIKYFQKKKAERLRNSLLALPNDPDTIVEEVLRVVTSSPDVFLLSADNLSMQRVDALLPEAARVVPRDQETVDQLEALTPSDVAAMFSHVPDPAQPKRTLRQVHLWTSTTSSSSASPAPGRGAVTSSSTSGSSCPTFRGALFYQSSVRHAYCTVKGVFVEVARDDGAEARHDERMNTKATTSLHAYYETQQRQQTRASGNGKLLRFSPQELELKTCNVDEQWCTRTVKLCGESDCWVAADGLGAVAGGREGPA